MPDLELIVIDDGSTDGTTEVLQEKISRIADKVLYHSQNRRKGAALRSGIGAASGEVLLVQDADLEYRPEDYSGAVLCIPGAQSSKDLAAIKSRRWRRRYLSGGLRPFRGSESDTELCRRCAKSSPAKLPLFRRWIHHR